MTRKEFIEMFDAQEEHVQCLPEPGEEYEVFPLSKFDCSLHGHMYREGSLDSKKLSNWVRANRLRRMNENIMF